MQGCRLPEKAHPVALVTLGSPGGDERRRMPLRHLCPQVSVTSGSWENVGSVSGVGSPA